jgi:hypothetical protein
VSDADWRVRLAVAIIRALRVVVWCVAHVPRALPGAEDPAADHRL